MATDHVPRVSCGRVQLLRIGMTSGLSAGMVGRSASGGGKQGDDGDGLVAMRAVAGCGRCQCGGLGRWPRGRFCLDVVVDIVALA